MEIRPVGADLFHADRRTDMTKLYAILWTRQKIKRIFHYSCQQKKWQFLNDYSQLNWTHSVGVILQSVFPIIYAVTHYTFSSLDEQTILRNSTFPRWQILSFYLLLHPLASSRSYIEKTEWSVYSAIPYCPLGTSLDHLVDNSLWTVPGLSIWPPSSREHRAKRKGYRWNAQPSQYMYILDRDGEKQARKTRNVPSSISTSRLLTSSLLKISFSLSLFSFNPNTKFSPLFLLPSNPCWVPHPLS